MKPEVTMRVVLVLLASAVITLCSTAHARDLWSDEQGESSLKLSTTLIGMGLLSAPPRHPLPDRKQVAGTSFGEVRIELLYRFNREIQFDVAYDNRMTWSSGVSTGAIAALPSNTPGPYRIGQVGGVVARSGKYVDYNELDRASLGYQTGTMNLTIGRQAVGWGRGALFSAVDIFAPFTPLEINREWRRGVDAARADIKISDTASIDLVTAWGPTWDQSALGIRVRGYAGPLDAELLFAKRATDYLYGITSSAAVGDFEVHGEFAIFQTPGDLPFSSMFGNRRLVPKAVVGISNNFTIGTGLKVLLEYHYSGFGVSNPKTLPFWLITPDYRTRYQRGDTQIPGKQALALQAAYTFNERWNGSFELLQSLADCSGVLVPTVSWDITEKTSLQGALFYGYGPSPRMGLPRSQFGGVAPTLILKVSFYD